MNNDRFKFRIYSKVLKRYYEDNDRILHIHRSISYQEALHMCLDDCGVIIEQCVGLKDINGRLIYEGDIVKVSFDITKISDEIFLTLTIEERGQGFKLLKIESLIDCMGLPEDIEIIGDIHSNPEMIKE